MHFLYGIESFICTQSNHVGDNCTLEASDTSPNFQVHNTETQFIQATYREP